MLEIYLQLSGVQSVSECVRTGGFLDPTGEASFVGENNGRRMGPEGKILHGDRLMAKVRGTLMERKDISVA